MSARSLSRAGAFTMMLACLAASQAVAQQSAAIAGIRKGRIVFDTVHSRAVADNKYGDSPDREVLVYLPPSYDSTPAKRFPVVYLLHGFGASDRSWVQGFRGFSIGPAMDTLVTTGAVREMIIVMPSARTRLGGSFYVNSESTGDWEDFITRELVAYIDGKYRTLARPSSRGLAGHSMGGYGTFEIGFHQAGDVFDALYAMSACCTKFSRQLTPDDVATWETLYHLTSLNEVRSLSFYPEVLLALSAAFSPNVNRGPLFADFPFEFKHERWDGIPGILEEWAEHSPYDMVIDSASRIRRLHGLAFDIGTHDDLVQPSLIAGMDSILTRYRVPHTYETYDGDHVSGIGARMTTRVLPFFSRTLDFSGEPH